MNGIAWKVTSIVIFTTLSQNQLHSTMSSMGGPPGFFSKAAPGTVRSKKKAEAVEANDKSIKSWSRQASWHCNHRRVARFTTRFIMSLRSGSAAWDVNKHQWTVLVLG